MYNVPASAGERGASDSSSSAIARLQPFRRVVCVGKKVRRSNVATSCMDPPWVFVCGAAHIAVTCSDDRRQSAGFPTDLTKCVARCGSRSQQTCGDKCRHVQTCEVGDIIDARVNRITEPRNAQLKRSVNLSASARAHLTEAESDLTKSVDYRRRGVGFTRPCELSDQGSGPGRAAPQARLMRSCAAMECEAASVTVRLCAATISLSCLFTCLGWCSAPVRAPASAESDARNSGLLAIMHILMLIV